MDDIMEIVWLALCRVYDEQIYLINNRVSERSIVFWFGIYFHELMQGTEFESLDIDVEYNRNFQDAKRTENFERGTFPDFILHERGSNENNILIIEFKPWWNAGTDDDIIKLGDFTATLSGYNYDIGLSILLGQESPTCIVVEDGEVSSEITNE